MKKIIYPRWVTLLVLVGIFIAPGLIAYEYYVHRSLATPTTNQGRILRPPPLLTLPFSGARWRMVLWQPQACSYVCERELDHLARVRLALGRRLYNVDVVLLLASNDPLVQWQHDHASLVARMQEHDLSTLMVSKDNLEMSAAFGNKAGVYLVNPQKYAVLSYPEIDFSDALFHDLKHILSNT